MLIDSTKKYLYNIKDFESKQKVWTVKFNQQKYENIVDKLNESLDQIIIKYYSVHYELSFILAYKEYLNFKSAYKIIYGYFYNNANYFLYKSSLGEKTLSQSISKCKYKELLFNDHKDLICSKSYDILRNQIESLNKDKISEYEEEHNYLLPIKYNDETLIITDNIDAIYNEGILAINI